MTNNKVKIIRDNGVCVDAQAPIIISASRSTDIPAFYSDWFLSRLKRGYSAWTNPFNGVRSYISYQNTRMIVFWSKNPKPLLDRNGLLDYLEEKDINCYIQFTLNDYTQESLERGVPNINQRIETFKALVSRLGLGRVIWRFDPLILTDTMGIDNLLDKIAYIGNQLKGYTEKLVFSYADIAAYRKVKANLETNHIKYREFNISDMIMFASELQKLNKEWGYILATCGEKIDLEQFGIIHNKCIDDDLMIKYFSQDTKLMKFIGIESIEPDIFTGERRIIKKRATKDNGQRKFCGCIVSKDIGEYDTCPHLCEYCYANTSKESALNNYKRSRSNINSETITGK